MTNFLIQDQVIKVKKNINESQICLYIKISIPFLSLLIGLLCLAPLCVFARVTLHDLLAV